MRNDKSTTFLQQFQLIFGLIFGSLLLFLKIQLRALVACKLLKMGKRVNIGNQTPKNLPHQLTPSAHPYLFSFFFFFGKRNIHFFITKERVLIQSIHSGWRWILHPKHIIRNVPSMLCKNMCYPIPPPPPSLCSKC